MVRRPGALSFVLGLLIGLPATGCSDSDKAATLPSATPRPSTSATGSEFPKTPEGAAAFARSFINAITNAQATGNTTHIVRMSSASCRSCDALIAFVDRSYEGGGRIEGGALSVLSEAAPAFEGDRVTVTVIADQDIGRVLDAEGEPVSDIEHLRAVDVEVALSYASGRWQVTELTQQIAER